MFYSHNMIETQNNTVSENLLNKIKGLLRLATSSNQHEAELAMQRAKSLCIKNEIEMATLDAFSDGKPKANEPIVQDHIDLGNRMPISQRLVSRILSSYFNVKVLYSGGRNWGRSVVLIGRKMDIELATYLNSHLNNEFLRLWRKFYSDNKNSGVTLRDRPGFMVGLSQGLSRKLDEAQKQTENESFAAMHTEYKGESVLTNDANIEKIKNCYALAVVNLKKTIDEKTKEFYPNLGKNYTRQAIHNYNSIDAGRAMGRTISTNRPLSYGGQKSIN
jgi:hypothetical protein